MRDAPTLDSVLDAAMQLASTEQGMLVEILRKRRIEQRRNEIATHAHEARKAFRRGRLATETADDLIERLHTAGQEAEDE